MIKERRGPPDRRAPDKTDQPAAVLRRTVGRDKAPAQRPAYLDPPVETEEHTEIPQPLAPNWLLLILILLVITIIILLVVLLLQR